MVDVLVLQHDRWEGPGPIGDALQRRGLSTHVVRTFAGDSVPPARDAAGLVVMGGPMGVYETDRHPYLRDELRLIEDALRCSRPVLGVCLGSQLLPAALGARVYPSGYKEIGWYAVELSDTAAADGLLHDVPRRFTALHWHGDVFDLPAGAVCLASSELTARQAFRYGEDAYGLLFHLEVTTAQLEGMVGAFADEIAAAGVAAAAILDPTPLPTLQRIGTTVFDRFAERVARQK